MAQPIIALEHGEPLDEVVYCEVMFDENISAEVPEHRDFIYDKAIPWLERNGIGVTTIRSHRTFISEFHHTIARGAHEGKIWSWPLCGKCYIQRDCKARPLNKYKRSLPAGTMQYIGYANDEQDRLLRLNQSHQTSLLKKYEISEAMAFDICKKHGLLSPIYEFAPRNGCFFCPNAKWPELRHLYDHHPDLWSKLLALQQVPNKATEMFNREYRFDEIDREFRLDDAQYDIFRESEPIPFEEK